MNFPPKLVRTRGGLLIAIVMTGVVWFELRTVVGMLLGVDIPAVPYLIAGLVVISALAVFADLSRSEVDQGRA